MLRRLRTRVIRKSAFVSLLLAAIMGFTVEPVVGVVRDGGVHHETAVEAAAHSSLASADHAHEHNESSETPAPDGTETSHEHGSNADHCTHSHGIAYPAVLCFDFFTTTSWLETDFSQPNQSVLPTSATPPPNA